SPVYRGSASHEGYRRGEDTISLDAEAEIGAPLPAKVGRVVALVQVAHGTPDIGGLHLEVVALSDKRGVEAQAGAHGPAPPIGRMAGCRQAVTVRYGGPAEIVRIDLVCGSHDLGATPGLV